MKRILSTLKNNIKSEQIYTICNYIIAFFLPVSLMLIICKLIGIYPMEDKSWLILDMDNQYISYFSYLREAVMKHGIFYSFSKNLGGDMIGFSAYYLLSPLNIFFLFSSKNFLPNMVAIVSIAKIGLSGLTFQKLINYNQKKWSNLLFSVSYALMGYSIFYLSNLMWFDAVYMLPIIILGVKKLVDHKKSIGYIVALSYSIITNYYISYMVCIFVAFFFVYYLLCCNNGKIKEKFMSLIRFGVSSLIAGGLCFWLLLPTKYALDGVKGDFDFSKLTWDKNFYWNDILAKLMPFSTENLMKGMPNIYCGFFVLFLIGVYFFSFNEKLRKKIGMLALFGILYFSLYVDGLNLIWHGFNYPIGFPYRYSFILSFLMILCASEGFEQAYCMSVKNRIVAGIASLTILSIIILMVKKKQIPFIASNVYAYSFILLVIVFVLFLLINKKTYIVAILGGVLLIGYDLVSNGVDALSELEPMATVFLEIQNEQTEEQVKYIQEYDNTFYRMEKNYFRTMNDPMMYDFAGLSHYSSSEPSELKAFLGNVGFRNNGNFAFYNRGSSLSIESFLGVKYLLSRKQLVAPYKYVGKVDSTYIYENPYAFSIGYLTDANLEEFPEENDNKFEFQNEIFAATCFEEGIFIKQNEYSSVLYNLDDLGCGTYQKIDYNNEAYIEYSFIVESDYPIDLYFNSSSMKLAQVWINDKSTGNYFDIKQYDIIRVQDYVDVKKGEELKIKVKALESTLQIDDVEIYYENQDCLRACYDYQAENDLELVRASDDTISGSFDNVDNRYNMFFSIPYSKGWKVYIDGKKVKSVNKTGIFFSISDVPEGKHEIVLRYIPEGFTLGMVITLISLIMFVGVWYYDRKKYTYGKKELLYSFIFVGFIVVSYISLRFYEPKPLIINKAQTSEEKDTVYLGTYEQDGNIDNGEEPIEWQIVGAEDGKVLLVSKYALEYMPYIGNTVTALWEDSAVREWTNNEFYHHAFNDEEKKKILLSIINNKDCSTEFTSAGANTEDYVFILDKQQIEKYFRIDSYYDNEHFFSQNAICSPTEYARKSAQEYNIISDELYRTVLKGRGYSDDIVGKTTCNYWVRNPGLYTPINTVTVDDTGSLFEIGTFGTNKCYVRPAMWVEADFLNYN